MTGTGKESLVICHQFLVTALLSDRRYVAGQTELSDLIRVITAAPDVPDSGRRPEDPQ